MRRASVLMLCGLAGCVTPGDLETVSPRQLNEAPEAYDGKRVQVEGYVLLGTNGRSIYTSKDRFELWATAFRSGDSSAKASASLDAYRDDCLTMANDDVIWDHQEALAFRTMTLSGTFVRNYYSPDVIDLQKCPGASALVVERASVVNAARQGALTK